MTEVLSNRRRTSSDSSFPPHPSRTHPRRRGIVTSTFQVLTSALHHRKQVSCLRQNRLCVLNISVSLSCSDLHSLFLTLQFARAKGLEGELRRGGSTC